MKTFDTKQLIIDLKGITDNNIQLVQSKFNHLNEKQKTWRPSSESWSVVEIFAHLNEYALFYHRAFQERIQKTKFDEPKDNFVSSPLGRSAWRSMKLGRVKNVKRKFKAPKAYNPSNEPSLVKGDDINSFGENQKEMLRILEMAKNVNLRKVKIPISISRIVRLRLGDALMFVIYHNERHVQQALNVLSHPNFPNKK